jgi:hypothetical protein
MADGVEETPAIPGLPNHLVVAHILRSDFLRDPADLAVLRRVSRGMRDAVDATGRKIEELREDDAAERGYLSTLKCLRRQGRLCNNRLLCAYAARGGHLEVLKWARENGCPWDEKTCAHAARGGHLKVLKWARENGCPWDEIDVRVRGERWPPRGAEVGARQRLPVGRGDVRARGVSRPPRGAEVGARERLPVVPFHTVGLDFYGEPPRLPKRGGALVGADRRRVRRM